jgi:ABC-type branched-subunit amino acid transport system substrate-binding protein
MVAIVLAAVSSVGLGTAAASTQGAKSVATASDVGITPTTIRIAVVADVDNALSPGVLQPVVDGMTGAVKYINANGGVAGRKLQLDFIDSKLNPNDARNAIIKACGEDFALVGTGTLALATVDDEVACKDAAGNATGLPDLGAIVTSVAQACSPVSYPVTPNPIDCSTVDKVPQTYRGAQGDYKYLLKKHGKLNGPFIQSADSKNTQRSGAVAATAATQAGIVVDHNWPVSSRDPQSAYTPIIQQMKTDGSNYSYAVVPPSGAVLERQEAALQNLPSDVVWECNLGCYYDKSFVAAGNAVDGEYIPIPFLPFEETSSNKTNAAFVKYVGKDKVSGVASWGFTAGILFQQAAKAAVAKRGDDNITRKDLLAALAATHAFNADGMSATVDVGNRVPTSCFVLVQFKNGKFVRTYPTKKGTFDCTKSNLVTFQADLLHQ